MYGWATKLMTAIVLLTLCSCSKAVKSPASNAEDAPVSKVAEEPAGKADAYPQEMPEESIDHDTEAYTAKWYPYVRIFDLTTPWRPIVSGDEDIAVSTEPNEHSPISGIIPTGTQVDITGYDTRKIVDLGDPLGENAKPFTYYETYLKIKSGNVEGWCYWIQTAYSGIRYPYDWDLPGTTVAYVRFVGPLPVMREGPSPTAPKTTADIKVGKNKMYEVTTRIDDWFCLSSYGWFAADTKAVEFYYLTFVCAPGGDCLAFYFPVNKEFNKVYYEIDRFEVGRPYSHSNPLLSLITSNGKSIQGRIKKRSYWKSGTLGNGEYEVIFPKTVRRDEITQITFAVSQGDKRFSYTVDPREVWAEEQ